MADDSTDRARGCSPHPSWRHEPYGRFVKLRVWSRVSVVVKEFRQMHPDWIEEHACRPRRRPSDVAWRGGTGEGRRPPYRHLRPVRGRPRRVGRAGRRSLPSGHSVEVLLLKIYAKWIDGGTSLLRRRVQHALGHNDAEMTTVPPNLGAHVAWIAGSRRLRSDAIGHWVCTWCPRIRRSASSSCLASRGLMVVAPARIERATPALGERCSIP